MLRPYLRREVGQPRHSPDPLRAAASRLRAATLDLSTHVDLAPVHSQPVNALALEDVEGRYLLSAAADASIALYDVLDLPCEPSERSEQPVQPLARVCKGTHEDAHKYAVSSVAWFPHDTGAFVTGGYDEQVKLWDTNAMRVACEFALPGRVQCVAMSAAATTHALIAVAGAGCDIRLVDPSTGSAVHTLGGHRAPAWVTCWSPRQEHQLVSGGADGGIRVWDLRRASGWLAALDMQDTSDQRRSRQQETAGGGGGGGGGGGDGGARRSGGAVARRAPGGAATMAGKAAALAQPVAHHGAVSSLCFTPDGARLVSAGRDHRVRVWDAASGVNSLTHFAGAHNPASGCKQIGVSDAGGGAHAARLYFPTADGLLEYDLTSGARLRVLRGHFGATLCCVADPRAPRVFSGGEDGAVNAWTPPPCGVRRPAPAEPCVARDSEPPPPPPLPPPPREAAAAAAGYGLARRAHQQAAPGAPSGDDAWGGGAVSAMGARAADRRGHAAAAAAAAAPAPSRPPTAVASRAAEDEDAWSDDEDPPPPVRAHSTVRRDGGGNKRRKR